MKIIKKILKALWIMFIAFALSMTFVLVLCCDVVNVWINYLF